ncbi:MAG: 50S ribosomal protein L11 methyltransferase [Bacillota bacterium]|nr:50S ribosomal protein L11 methyltransferase [Bacillota bacterium]
MIRVLTLSWPTPNEAWAEELAAQASLWAGGAQYEDTWVKIFFEKAPFDLQTWLRDLEARSPQPLSVTEEEIQEEAWWETWKAYYRPLEVGSFWIGPPWWEGSPPTQRIPVIIDPGKAFGTGQHASTRLALLGLEEALSRSLPHRAADVGTGSGILALALWEWSQQKGWPLSLWAIDIDPRAVEAAEENFRRSAQGPFARHVQFLAGGPSLLPPAHDLILGNLTLEIHQEVAPLLAQKLGDGGLLVASGILLSEREAGQKVFLNQGLHMEWEAEEEGWWGSLWKKGGPLLNIIVD